MSGAAPAGRIGPNAVIRLAEALDALESKAMTKRFFIAADLGRYAETLPDAMVPEQEVTTLHHHLRSSFSQVRAASISWIAGLRTADYLLANRIPKPVQSLLRLLPKQLAAFILLKAIGRHAWTFAGSSRFTWAMGRPITLSFEDCPLCRGSHASAPCCGYYAATFEHLFRQLIAAETEVSETDCIATGGGTCRFEIRF